MAPPPHLPPSNSTNAGAEKCVVNDQMTPFTVLYLLIFIISLPGNLMSMWAFICRTRIKQSTSVYLLNLLLADLLLLLALPFKILKDLGVAPWSLMVFHCQASGVAIYISLYASIAFLAFIIIDCYLEVCRTSRLQEVGFARLLSLVVWLLLLILMVPNMALPIQQVPERQYLSCSSLKKDISLHWHSLTIYLCTALFLNATVAVLVSSVLALRRLLKAASLWAAGGLAAMVLVYMICFVPYHVVRTPYTLTQTKFITDCQTKRQLFLGKESTLFLAVMHIGLDPLLLLYLDSPLRKTLGEMVCQTRDQEAGDPAEMMTQITTTTN